MLVVYFLLGFWCSNIPNNVITGSVPAQLASCTSLMVTLYAAQLFYKTAETVVLGRFQNGFFQYVPTKFDGFVRNRYETADRKKKDLLP